MPESGGGKGNTGCYFSVPSTKDRYHDLLSLGAGALSLFRDLSAAQPLWLAALEEILSESKMETGLGNGDNWAKKSRWLSTLCITGGGTFGVYKPGGKCVSLDGWIHKKTILEAPSLCASIFLKEGWSGKGELLPLDDLAMDHSGREFGAALKSPRPALSLWKQGGGGGSGDSLGSVGEITSEGGI